MKKILFAALALIVVMASCVKDPQYSGVTISNVNYSPKAVQAGDDITVTATITGFKEFTPNLVYTVGTESPVTVVMAQGTEKGIYSAVIPGQEDGVSISFYVEVTDGMITKSIVTNIIVGDKPIDYSVIRINELNGNDYNEANDNGNDKFIELYNTGTEKVNLKGCFMLKDDGTEPVWIADAEVSIEAGAYLLLYSKKAHGVTGYPENLIFDSGLSSSKPVRIQLMSPANEKIDDFNLITCVTPAAASYSRNADGRWYHAPATPGAVNEEGTELVEGIEGGDTPEPPTPDHHNLVLNELNGSEKFIEIYNKGDMDLSMEGLYLLKDEEPDTIWMGVASVVVPAKGYVVLVSKKASNASSVAPELIFQSGLSSSKTLHMALYLAGGEQLDVFSRGEAPWGEDAEEVGTKSFARTPNGVGEWKLADSTPGDDNPETGTDIP